MAIAGRDLARQLLGQVVRHHRAQIAQIKPQVTHPTTQILHGGRSFTSRRSTAEIATTAEPSATSTTKTTATIGPASATAPSAALLGQVLHQQSPTIPIRTMPTAIQNTVVSA